MHRLSRSPKPFEAGPFWVQEGYILHGSRSLVLMQQGLLDKNLYHDHSFRMSPVSTEWGGDERLGEKSWGYVLSYPIPPLTLAQICSEGLLTPSPDFGFHTGC